MLEKYIRSQYDKVYMNHDLPTFSAVHAAAVKLAIIFPRRLYGAASKCSAPTLLEISHERFVAERLDTFEI
jgi:hypothetical protein